MKRKILMLLAALLLAAAAGYLIYLNKPTYIEKISATLQTQRLKSKTAVFKDVNLVSMNSEQVLKDKTVLIENGVIKGIGGTPDIKIPEGSLVIDGKNKYLMPGLTDMHVHLIVTKNDLLLYLANGVTTVRNMAGAKAFSLNPTFGVTDHVKLEKQIKEGKLLGPTVYSAGSILESKEGPTYIEPYYFPADSSKQAEKAVINTRDWGFGFVKIYNKLPLEAFEAAVKKAKEYNLQVIGHVPHAANLGEVISKKQLHTIEHLSGYMNHFDGFKIPGESLDEYAKLTSNSGVWNCPTIVVWQNLVPAGQLDSSRSNVPMKYASPLARKLWRNNIEYYSRQIAAGVEGFKTTPSEHIEDYFLLTKKLHGAGAPLLLGTDSGTLNVVPGFSIHQELKNLVRAGLSPYEALKAGTCDAAFCMNKADEYGTIAVGKRADLLLLHSNPLESVENVNNRLGVMTNGLWLTQKELDRMLEELAKHYD